MSYKVSIKSEIGNKLKEARLTLKPKLTREKMAEKIGVSSTTIYRWENGVDFPSHENLSKVSRLLNVDLNELIKQPQNNMSTLTGVEKNPRIEAYKEANRELAKEVARLENLIGSIQPQTLDFLNKLTPAQHMQLLNLWNAHESASKLKRKRVK